jgi:hypothetical protein
MLTMPFKSAYTFPAGNTPAGCRSPNILGGQPLTRLFYVRCMASMGGHVGSRKACRFQGAGLRTRMYPPTPFAGGSRETKPTSWR